MSNLLCFRCVVTITQPGKWNSAVATIGGMTVCANHAKEINEQMEAKKKPLDESPTLTKLGYDDEPRSAVIPPKPKSRFDSVLPFDSSWNGHS